MIAKYNSKKPSWTERIAYVLEQAFISKGIDGLVFYDVLRAKTNNSETYTFHTIELDVGNNVTSDVVVLPTVTIHLVAASAASAASRANFYENPTYDDQTGTELISYNNDRENGVDDGVTTVIHGPDITDPGTELSADVVPGGDKNRAIGAVAGPFPEWILKADTPYLIRITNTSGGGEDISIIGQFYAD